MAGADRNNEATAPVAFGHRSSPWRRLASGGEASIPGVGLVFKSLGIAIPAVALALATSLHVMTSLHPAVAALDLAAQAIVARDAFVCQSPWHVIEGRDCHKLPAGTEVNIVGGDEFFACVVWPGTQRCMWIARDQLRKP
jgi:hypothetical protein